jgi:hypothetical protein
MNMQSALKPPDSVDIHNVLRSYDKDHPRHSYVEQQDH